MAETSSKKPGFFSKVKNWFKGIGKFFRDTASEMKKVVWPSKKQIINNTIFQPFLVFFLVGAFYFALCYPLSRWSEAMEKKLNVANR